jgi:hypothetical protein
MANHPIVPVRPSVSVAVCSAVAISLAACGRDAPTAPTASASPSTQVAAASLIVPAGVGQALDDASTRLVPSLGDATARALLNGYLNDLSTYLAAGDVANARRSLMRARKAIGTHASAAERADLAAIELALAQAEAVLPADAAPDQK